MMPADEENLDFSLIEASELFRNIGTSRVAGKYSVVKVSSNQEYVRPVFQCEVYECFEASLEIVLPLKSLGAILDSRRVEVVVGRQKNMNCRRGYPPRVRILVSSRV